jgi:hypothetical protein
MYAITSIMMPAKPIIADCTVGSGSELAAVLEYGSNKGMGAAQSVTIPKIAVT